MRTTIDLPDDLLAAARSLARDRSTTLSQAVAELVRRGLGQSTPATVEQSLRTGLPVISIGRTLTTDDVRSLDDDV